MKTRFAILLAAVIGLSSTLAYAKVESSAIMSPSCTAEQIKEIAGDAIVSISKNKSWGNEVKGFIISLDTDKLTYGELVKKMQEKKCFN